ncbi:MAG: hypothetical protein JXN65_10595 [Clostridia bacterium]|nr:hypothetical protein [Clostridia bacterium]
MEKFKKALLALAVLSGCFIVTSFSYYLLLPFADNQPRSNSDIYAQRLYAIMNATEDICPIYTDINNPVIEELSCILASNMIIDYGTLSEESVLGEIVTVSAMFIDPELVKIENTADFNYSAYNEYIPLLEKRAMEQLYGFVGDESLYTKEYTLRIKFDDAIDPLNPKAQVIAEDIENIQNDSYQAAENIYSDYISKSDISTAYFCQAIKELPLDNIAEIYNENNPENQLTEEWQKSLFAEYSKQYIDNLIIDGIIKAGTNNATAKATINYSAERGDETIDKVCNMLLEFYYENKQPQVDKSQVIKDFGNQLISYQYNSQTALYAKSFDFTYSQHLNEFTINDDFYAEIVNNIYEEFIYFEDIFNSYYPVIEEKYFFTERPFDATTIITDNAAGSRYREVNISVNSLFDCYIKLYSYDTTNDSLNSLMLEAYIKSGDSLQVFIPEGDYVFKYATGPVWYGSLYLFSDSGQYFAASNVISVHEYMMTTAIELGSSASSIPVNSQTPDIF